MLATDVRPWLQADIEARHCCEMQAIVQQFNDTGETRLQGGEMQGSSGSTEFHYLIVFEVVSSSSSSVGVMQVEDTRRVTQAVLAMVRDCYVMTGANQL